MQIRFFKIHFEQTTLNAAIFGLGIPRTVLYSLDIVKHLILNGVQGGKGHKVGKLGIAVCGRAGDIAVV